MKTKQELQDSAAKARSQSSRGDFMKLSENGFPVELILKRNSMDFIGVKLAITHVTKGNSPTSYYAKHDGSCSKSAFVAYSRWSEIERGEHGSLFLNLEALHSSILRKVAHVTNRIESYRHSGDYFSYK